MTDEELNALVQELLGKQVCTGFEQTEPYTIDCVYGPDPVCQHAAATITTLRECEARLRAQLAEAKKDADKGAKDYCVLVERHDAEKVRADRAEQRVATLEHEVRLREAALAAQIEVYAPSDQERNYLHLHDAAYSVWRWFQIARPDLIGPRAERLRAAVIGPRPYGDTQPHDRTALDRMLTEAREKALRGNYKPETSSQMDTPTKETDG